jgi:dTDP-4-dehydrorhamnose reductase
MRVLVTGAAGQLGTDLVAHCSASGDDVVGVDRSLLDVCDRSAVLSAITTLRPDAVVNCAAWTAVDACEDDPDRALAANGAAVRGWPGLRHTGALGHRLCLRQHPRPPYHEWDATNPQSVYGCSKLAGEREALALGSMAAVVRTSWVCGQHGANMVKTILRLAGERPSLQFVDDQIGHPTFTHDLAPVLRRIALDRLSGVVHATNQGAVSWFEFAQAVVAAMGKDPAMVSPISTAQLVPARPAPRPANSVLDNTVLRSAGYPALRDFREPLRETVAALLA